MMKEQLEAIRKGALEAIAGTKAAAELDALRVKYLGKKGELTAVLKLMGSLSAEERPVMGQMANEVRAAVEKAVEAQSAILEKAALEAKLKAETLDVTIPGKEVALGHKHPMYTVLDEIKQVFLDMGFEIMDGPEIELESYNFTKLNAPESHPSRDWTDTFYLTEDSKILLRTQTSPMQIRAMEAHGVPIRMISPGRVYRKDEVDATHSPMFHQIEGLVIDKGVTMADLKGTLNAVIRKLYGPSTVTRFRQGEELRLAFAGIGGDGGARGDHRVHHGLVAFLGFRLFLHVGKTAGKHGFHSGGIQFRTGSMVAHT